MDEADLIREVYRRAWRLRLDQMSHYMFANHPDLDPDQDSRVLTEEDLNELKWLDAEIGIEHISGCHQDGCPVGCIYRGL